MEIELDKGNDQIPDTCILLSELYQRLDECDSREWHELLANDGQQQQQLRNGNFDGIKCQISALSSATGYLSRIWRLCLISADGQRQIKAVIKCPNPDYVAKMNLIGSNKEEFDAFMTILVQFHCREVFFYSELYQTCLAGTNFVGFLPRPFAWKDCADVQGLGKAFILLEDLSKRGKPPEEPNNLSKEQIEATIRAISQLHAHSLCIPPHIHKQIHALQAPHRFRYRPEQIFQKLCAPENVCAEWFQANRNILQTFMEDGLCSEKNDDDGICTEFGIRPVLAHSDLWSNNLLFDRNNPNKLVAILDWQFVQPGTGINDLAHLFVGSVAVDNVRKHQQGWIELYFSEMDKLNARLGKQMPIGSVEQMERVFSRHLPAMLHFEMQMLLLNEEAGESGECARRRQERIKQLFDNFVVGTKTEEE